MEKQQNNMDLMISAVATSSRGCFVVATKTRKQAYDLMGVSKAYFHRYAIELSPDAEALKLALSHPEQVFHQLSASDKWIPIEGGIKQQPVTKKIKYHVYAVSIPDSGQYVVASQTVKSAAISMGISVPSLSRYRMALDDAVDFSFALSHPDQVFARYGGQKEWVAHTGKVLLTVFGFISTAGAIYALADTLYKNAAKRFGVDVTSLHYRRRNITAASPLGQAALSNPGTIYSQSEVNSEIIIRPVDDFDYFVANNHIYAMRDRNNNEFIVSTSTRHQAIKLLRTTRHQFVEYAYEVDMTTPEAMQANLNPDIVFACNGSAKLSPTTLRKVHKSLTANSSITRSPIPCPFYAESDTALIQEIVSYDSPFTIKAIKGQIIEPSDLARYVDLAKEHFAVTSEKEMLLLMLANIDNNVDLNRLVSELKKYLIFDPDGLYLRRLIHRTYRSSLDKIGRELLSEDNSGDLVCRINAKKKAIQSKKASLELSHKQLITLVLMRLS